MNKIKYKFWIALVIGVMAFVGSLSYYFSIATQKLLDSQLRQEIIHMTETLAFQVVEGIQTENLFNSLDPFIETSMQNENVVSIEITDISGKIVAHSDSSRVGITSDIIPETEFKLGSQPIVTVLDDNYSTVVPVMKPTSGVMSQAMEIESDEAVNTQIAGNSGVLGFVTIKLSTKNMHAATRSIYLNITGLAALATLVCLMLVYWLSNGITRPLEILAKATKQFSRGEFFEKIHVDTNDEFSMLAQSFNDMAEKISQNRDNLESQVELRTKELQEANKELESFSYSVSHDLRAPLRSIDGYTRILQEDYTEVLDEEGIRVLDIVLANTQKMGNLIDDLLAFSRMGRKQLEKSEFDMNLVVKEVTEDLLRDTAEKVDIKINPLPTTYGDMTTIRQVMTNLVSNAIKYSSKKELPEIEIGGQMNGEAITYFIKDNGVGFDMAYYDKLFGIFQRLHSVEEFHGTGIGLSIVKRIIDKHDGEVWAEGELNKGAIFYFKLPLNNNNN